MTPGKLKKYLNDACQRLSEAIGDLRKAARIKGYTAYPSYPQE
jgi:hypothetical protein